MGLDMFNKIKFAFHKPSHVNNLVFQLYYKWTVFTLLLISLIITCRIWFGDSFECQEQIGYMDPKVATKVCYSQSVYFNPDGYINAGGTSDRHPKKFYFYYKWVNIILLLHAFVFYLPHAFWRCYENGFTWRLVSSIENVGHGKTKNTELQNLANNVNNLQGKHIIYTLMYILSELANIITSLTALQYLVKFFDITPAPESIHVDTSNWSDFAHYYFPNMGTCIIKKLGASGDLQLHNVTCTLYLNHMYMYVYFILKTWYICLTVLSGMVLFYRILLLIAPLRFFVLKIRTPLVEASIVQDICYRISYSDWFFLTRLQKVMLSIDFAEMLNKLVGNPKTTEIASDKREETIATATV